jgi:pimeloyl-ACP methyl ester carboxylesterase
MKLHTSSQDGLRIHYEISGKERAALLFVQGWLGNTTWWNSQVQAFSKKYQVVCMDLAGQGQSERNRPQWSVHGYAADIQSVARQLDADKIVLIGHSMSGSNVVQASLSLPNTAAIILVDTLHNIDEPLPQEEVGKFFGMLRANYRGAVESSLKQFLFVPQSPPDVVSRISSEFLQFSMDHAIATLEPFYSTDIREAAKQVKVPVRAINSEMLPTHSMGNKKYFRDFDFTTISNVGHYPMLEKPAEFNQKLETLLTQLGI